MGKEITQFKQGNPGRPKGAKNHSSEDAKRLFFTIMDGQIAFIEDSLDKVRQKDPALYLSTLSKLMPYFIPKKLEIDAPKELTVNVKRRD